jgi:hypothetical protein
MDGVPAAAAVDPSRERCPSCGIQRKAGARFCETCRYDFKAPSSTDSTVSPGVTETAFLSEPVGTSAGPTAVATAATRYWEAVVSVHPALDVDPDPNTPCPIDTPDRTFPLDLPENLVGRRSAARGILPTIVLNDPGVSHRHLMVYRNPDATLTVSDLGSTNGTFLNASTQRLEPGVKTPVADGDRVELGRWTRIAFHCRS